MLILKDGDSASKRRYCLSFGWIQVMRHYGHVIWTFLVYVAASSNQKLLSSRSTGGTNYVLRVL